MQNCNIVHREAAHSHAVGKRRTKTTAPSASRPAPAFWNSKTRPATPFRFEQGQGLISLPLCAPFQRVNKKDWKLETDNWKLVKNKFPNQLPAVSFQFRVDLLLTAYCLKAVVLTGFPQLRPIIPIQRAVIYRLAKVRWANVFRAIEVGDRSRDL